MLVPANWSDPLTTKPPYLANSRFVKKPATEDYGGPGGYTNPAAGVRNATLGEDNVQQHMLEYYASVTALDAEIGRVLDRLEDPNGDGNPGDSITNNTWVVFMGDNGWQTGHHKFTSKVLAYEEASRVPLIVKGPGVAPRIETKLALNIDLTPMFYDLAGLPVPKHLQGRNLRKLVENPAAPWRDRFYYEAVVPENSLGAKPHDAIRTNRYKLIRTYATKAGAMSNTTIIFEELYDLDADPGEMNNLATDPVHSATKADLVAQLQAEKAAIASSPDPPRRVTGGRRDQRESRD
jgi:arylsulfatase A-like enzyme